YYRDKLKPLVKQFGTRKLRQLHLTDWDTYKKALIGKELENCSINHHLKAAKAVLNWAVDAEYLLKSPWKKIKRLPEEGRRRVITDEEFRALLRHSRNAAFRQVLITLRLTAARPGEIRCLTWSMVNWQTHCW